MTRTRDPRPHVVSVVAFLLLFLGAVIGFPFSAWGESKRIQVGQQVPEFSLAGIDGIPVSFEKDIIGNAPLTVLFFMTTACSACYEELREISDFVRKKPGRIDVWCVAVDLRGSSTVLPYQKANQFPVEYLIDPKFSLPRLFGFNYTPSLAILDSKGVVLHKKGGYSPDERLSDLLRAFMK